MILDLYFTFQSNSAHKRYEISSARDEPKAIKELVSNALDNSSALDQVGITCENGHLTIRNDKVLPLDALLLGKSYSRGDTCKIGQWGEGLKAAALVLLRAGRSMLIECPDKTIRPKLKAWNLGGKDVQTLSWQVVEEPAPVYGTKITVETSADIEGIKGEYLAFNRPATYLIDSDEGQLWTPNQGEPAAIYVRGKFISKLETALYSYNHKTSEINRDRNTVDMYQLRYLVGRIMRAAKKPARQRRTLWPGAWLRRCSETRG